MIKNNEVFLFYAILCQFICDKNIITVVVKLITIKLSSSDASTQYLVIVVNLKYLFQFTSLRNTKNLGIDTRLLNYSSF